MKKVLLLAALTACIAPQSFAKKDMKPPVTMPLAIKVVDEVLALPKPKNSWQSWVLRTSQMTAMRCLGEKRLKELSERDGYGALNTWNFNSSVFSFERGIEDVCTNIVKHGIYPVCERTGRFVSEKVVKDGLLDKVNFSSINLASLDDTLSSRQGINCAITKDVPKEQFYSGRTTFKWLSKPLKEVENPTLQGEISFNDVIEGSGERVQIPMKVVILGNS